MKCEICGKIFRQITTTHLKKHNITVYEYKIMFPNSLIMEEDISNFLSNKCKEQNKNENFGFKYNHKVNQGKIPWNKGISIGHNKALKKRIVSDDTRLKISKAKKKWYKEHPGFNAGEKNAMFGKKLSEKHVMALLGAKQTNNRINKIEKEAYRTLIQYGFRYVGDRSLWLRFKDGTHKCPDFINNDMKIIVEVYGDYWHKNDNPEGIINKYKEIGWKCYVFWEHEIMKENFNPEYFEQTIGIFEEEEFTYEDFDGRWML